MITVHMATSHSHGPSLSLSVVFLNQPGGQTPQQILTQNGLIDMDLCKGMPFTVKIETCLNPWPLAPKTGQIWHILIAKKISSKNRR